MLQLTVEINHIEELIDDLSKFIGEIDPTPLLEDAGAFMLNRIRTRFLAEKDPDDNTWTPSKAAIKRRSEGGGGTLFDSGKLFRSIQFAHTDEGEAMIGTDVDYAPYMHYGYLHHISGKQVGPWPFMGISQADANDIELILIQRVEEMIDKFDEEY